MLVPTILLNWRNTNPIIALPGMALLWRLCIDDASIDVGMMRFNFKNAELLIH
jgi:hypothetical protein